MSPTPKMERRALSTNFPTEEPAHALLAAAQPETATKAETHAKESGRWSPHRWSPDKIRRHVRHVFRHVNDVLGIHAGALVEHQIRTRIAELESVEEFRRRNIKTIGEEVVVAVVSSNFFFSSRI